MKYATAEDIRKKKRWELIIALASNPAIFSNEDGTPNTYGEKGIKANCHYIINQADAIIEELKDEPDEPKTTST